MTTTHTDIDGTSFANRIANRAELPPSATPESVAAEVMCALVERLTPGAAHELVQALPPPLRPLFARCVDHRAGLVDKFHRPELLRMVADRWGITPQHAERVCVAVFGAVRSYLPDDLVDAIAHQLPADLRGLWLSPLPLPSGRSIGEADEMEHARTRIYADIERCTTMPSGVDAPRAFAAVMCTLSRRLSGGEARHLLLVLPGTLRPLVDACMLHRSESPETFGEPEFARQVADHLGTSRDVAERVARCVFATVKRSIPAKDVADVAAQLSSDLRDLWLAS